MKIIDSEAYRSLLSDKDKNKMLQRAIKPGDKVYHEQYGAGEFVWFDKEHFYMAHVNFEDGEHVVTALDLETIEPGQVQSVKSGFNSGAVAIGKPGKELLDAFNQPEEKKAKKAKADELYADIPTEEYRGFSLVKIEEITLSGWNPRKNFGADELEELKKSIQEHGILEPLIVRPINGPNNTFISFELVAGERRYRAAKELGLKNVPAVIRRLSNHDVHEIMLIENLQRSNLEPLEEAQALEVILSDEVTTQEELAKKLGKSQSWIANRLRLLKAPDELKEMIISREITPKHVIALLPYTEYPVLREKILPEINRIKGYSGEVSVRQVENIVKSEITGDCDAVAVLQLNDFPYDKEQYRDFFDFSSCYNVAGTEKVPCICKSIFVQKEEYDPEDLEEGEQPPEDNKYCLNRRCWADKLNIAKQKYEKSRAKKVKKAGGDDTVDITKLRWDEYERIGKYTKWDKTECQTCEHNKKATGEKADYLEFVCLDPACAKRKEAEQRKREAQQAKEEAEQALKTMDAWIDTLSLESHEISKILSEKDFTAIAIPTANTRGLIKILVRHLWGDSIKKALKPWTTKAGKWNEAEIDKIPDDDVVKALLRLVFMQDLTAHNYQGVNVKAVEKVIAVFEGRAVPEEEE